MTPSRKVLIITQDTEVTRRILQEAHSLSNAGYSISILMRAMGTEDLTATVEGIPIECIAVRGRDPRFRWLYRIAGQTKGSQAAALWGVLNMHNTFALRALPRAIAARAGIYHARDLNNLPIAFKAARANNARLVYDAHELFPDVDNRWIKLKRKSWLRLERELMPHADLSITVNELIAEEMALRNNVPPPLVVLNCPDPPPGFNPTARHNIIRERLNLAAERKVVLYHGLIARGRGLESLVRCAPYLENDAAVVFLGYGSYTDTLKRMATDGPPNRVYFTPAVPPHDLLPYCASADVGIIPMQATGLNYYYTSPNRLFDFIQAATPIVANDLPYLRRIIGGNNLGIVSKINTPESYAHAINAILTLPDNGAQIRSNLLKIAPDYTWQAQAKKLIAAYQELGVWD